MRGARSKKLSKSAGCSKHTLIEVKVVAHAVTIDWKPTKGSTVKCVSERGRVNPVGTSLRSTRRKESDSRPAWPPSVTCSQYSIASQFKSAHQSGSDEPAKPG